MDYDDIVSELDTKWNAVVIAKPTFRDAYLVETAKFPNRVYIRINDGVSILPSAINQSLQPRQTTFWITIYAKDRADLELYMGEIRRIINAKTIAGGWWTIVSIPKYIKVRKRYSATMAGQEKLMIAATGWS